MDFVKDQSCRHLLNINSLVAVPDFVKQSSVDEDAVAGLNSHQFADPANREFPIDEAGHVYLSYAYMKSAGIVNPLIEQRIKKAASLFGIDEELARIDAAFAGETKSASADETQYAIALTKESGVTGYFPLNSSTDVESAATSIVDYKHRIPLPLFVDGCRNIVKAASQHKVPENSIPQLVKEYGEDRLVDTEHVKFAAEQRVRLTGDDVYKEIAEAADNDQDGNFDKYAELWFQADIQNDVAYDRFTQDPYQIFYSGISKAAFEQQTRDFLVLSNAAVPKQALANVPEQELQKYFPSKVAGDITAIIKQASTEATGPEIGDAISNLDAGTQKELLKLVLKHN